MGQFSIFEVTLDDMHSPCSILIVPYFELKTWTNNFYVIPSRYDTPWLGSDVSIKRQLVFHNFLSPSPSPRFKPLILRLWVELPLCYWGTTKQSIIEATILSEIQSYSCCSTLWFSCNKNVFDNNWHGRKIMTIFFNKSEPTMRWLNPLWHNLKWLKSLMYGSCYFLNQ